MNLSQSTDQIFINTHSSVFVADNYRTKNFKAEKTDGKSQIESIDILQNHICV